MSTDRPRDSRLQMTWCSSGHPRYYRGPPVVHGSSGQKNRTTKQVAVRGLCSNRSEGWNKPPTKMANGQTRLTRTHHCIVATRTGTTAQWVQSPLASTVDATFSSWKEGKLEEPFRLDVPTTRSQSQDADTPLGLLTSGCTWTGPPLICKIRVVQLG
jgi:hypothetical protein